MPYQLQANGKQLRGLAAMPKSKARKIQVMGGKSRPTQTFFVADEQIDNHIIEPFQPTKWWQGWFRRDK